MQVIRAEVLGMCFGVRDALTILAGVEQPDRVTVHGELVHNERVLKRLDAHGFSRVVEPGPGNRERPIPETPEVLITAHGVSDHERGRLLQAGKTLIDTTCPLVRRVHKAALGLAERGYFVVVVGKRGHVEVEGLVGDLDEFAVVERVEEVRDYVRPRIGVIAQTTQTVRGYQAIADEIRARNPCAEVRVVDTICRPTKQHQEALERLLDQVEVVVIVGGQNSNNTRQLVLRARERGRTAWHVQGAEDLDPAWFQEVDVVGLTAGTSTLEETIQEVQTVLEAMWVGKPRGSVLERTQAVG